MDPKPLTPQERGLRYRASRVNTAILDMVDRVRNGLAKGSEKVPLGKVSDSNAAQIQRETGIDTRGYDVAIEARQIEHILKDHGENGTSNRSMANPEDIARIEYALNNPDRITKSEPTKAYVTNKNGKMKPADTVLYETRLEDGSYYVVQAVPETKKKTLYVLTAFIGKSDYRNEAPRITNVNGPSATPEAESTVTPREATQSTDANYPSATPNGESAGASTNIVPEIISEVNRNPTPESDYYDEFESWGRDPIREGVENPMADRSYSGVGKRSVKAYMHENPAVKPFYQEQAAWLLSELADSTKGERTYNEQIHYESGGEQGWSGTKRHTSESIAELLDQDGMTYDQIERGLYAIINDSGQENNAVSKRIEFVINDRLMNGYTDFYTGKKVPGNVEYLSLLRNQQSAPSVDTQMGASNQSTESRQIKGTGAAEAGFSGKPAYNATLSEDNRQADRRDDVRPMKLPERDVNGGNVSAVTGNVYGSRITPDDFASLMEEPTAKGDFPYPTLTASS